MSGLGNKEIFSRNLQQYILKSGKERKEIALALDVSYSTFTDWVNGNKYPRIDKIEMLANYFDIKKSDLIEDPAKLPTQIDTSPATIDVTGDDFTYAMYNEGKELTPEQKQSVLDMVKFLKSQNEKKD